MSELLRVAVTMRRSDAQGYDEPRDALARDWTALFERHGLCPILIPGAARDPVRWARDLGAQALLLTGGESWRVDSARDATETALLEWARDDGAPVIGVCRGLHVVQVAFGGAVVPVDTAAHHVAVEHDLRVEEALATALHLPPADALRVNSYHELGVRQAAAELEPLAESGDGLVEILRHRQQPIVAVQCHPERVGGDPALEHWLFRDWLRGAAA